MLFLEHGMDRSTDAGEREKLRAGYFTGEEGTIGQLCK